MSQAIFDLGLEKEKVFYTINTLFDLLKEKQSEIEALKSKTNMLDEGWVMVPREFDPMLAEKMALECLPRPIQENDQTWIEIAENAYQDNLKSKKFEIMRTYKELIEQIQGASK